MCDLAEFAWLAEVEREHLAILQARVARGEGGPDLPQWWKRRAEFFTWLASEIKPAQAPGEGLSPEEYEMRQVLGVS